MLYQIWMEGFKFSEDEKASASYVGSASGESFEEAVWAWYANHPSNSFNAENLTEWGCRLFPSEYLARKSFG